MTATAENNKTTPILQLVLCARTPPLIDAWHSVADTRRCIQVHHGSVLEVAADAMVSPANSFGWMRGGIDELYSHTFVHVEQHVRSAILAYHGGELPVGQAVIVPTGERSPRWMISAPTMRNPGELLSPDTVHPYLAARAVFRLWHTGRLDNGTAVRDRVRVIAMPGLGTGYGGVPADMCAKQIAAAWDEIFGEHDESNAQSV